MGRYEKSYSDFIAAQNFERKSALFSLALSEVLIINMWANDVGRYSAANYDTLRTVFEINLKLFHSAEYVIGDRRVRRPIANPASSLPVSMTACAADVSILWGLIEYYTRSSPKTLLLFILRDHQTTPLENLAGTLLSDMENIWSEISKVSGCY